MNLPLPLTRINFIVLLFVVFAGSKARADLTLVADGQARAVIVTADKPSPAAGKGAALLAAQIERISGAKLPLVKESALSDLKIAGGAIHAKASSAAPEVFILVGESGLTRQLGATPEGLGAGGILLRTFANALVLPGTDERTPSDTDGTRYAVTTFLEDALGFRMLWPGELGLVAPPRSTVTVSALDRKFTPLIGQRNSEIAAGKVAADAADLSRESARREHANGRVGQ